MTIYPLWFTDIFNNWTEVCKNILKNINARSCTQEPPDEDVIYKALWIALKSDIQTTAIILSAKWTTPIKIMFKETLLEYIRKYS
tara:strand:- start:2691 stop:2945 length:255 start_codon:yes stop_codon:yes gene_type:complete